MQTSSEADEGAHSLETGHTSVGAFGEGGAPVPGVPPELDPRTPAFRPHSPGEASVFSVAVQPPASPKASIIEPSEPASHMSSPHRREAILAATASLQAALRPQQALQPIQLLRAVRLRLCQQATGRQKPSMRRCALDQDLVCLDAT